MKVKSSDSVRLLATPWTAAYQAPPSMGFSRQEYWSGVPLPSPVKQLNPIKKIHAVEAISVYREWRVNNVNMAFGQLRIGKE